MVKSFNQSRIMDLVNQYLPDCIKFFRDIIAIPSFSCGEKQVAERIKAEMDKLRFDKAWFDDFGNVIGCIGNGNKPRLVYDGHIDTVGVSDPSKWSHDPFKGKIENDFVYGRGASDNKAATAVQIYGAKILKELYGNNLPGTVFVLGSVQEEDCDGLACGYAVKESIRDVDAVVLGECTNCAIYRGHRGRMELMVRTHGVSCHASDPTRGENAIYKMAPIIKGIEKLNDTLGIHPFLGKGTIAVTKIECLTDSFNCVPYECTIYLDRRLTWGEDKESVIKEVSKVLGMNEGQVWIEVPIYNSPSWKGKVIEVEKYFPTWMLAEDHSLVQAGANTYHALFGEPAKIDKWTFSTNGTYTMGYYDIPTIGFGPSEERFSHSMDDKCPIEHLKKGMAFYATFPLLYTN